MYIFLILPVPFRWNRRRLAFADSHTRDKATPEVNLINIILQL